MLVNLQQMILLSHVRLFFPLLWLSSSFVVERTHGAYQYGHNWVGDYFCLLNLGIKKQYEVRILLFVLLQAEKMKLSKDSTCLFIKIICIGSIRLMVVLDELVKNLSHEDGVLPRRMVDTSVINGRDGKGVCFWNILPQETGKVRTLWCPVIYLTYLIWCIWVALDLSGKYLRTSCFSRCHLCAHQRKVRQSLLRTVPCSSADATPSLRMSLCVAQLQYKC